MNFTNLIDTEIGRVLDGVETFINTIYERHVPDEYILLNAMYDVLSEKIARMAHLARNCGVRRLIPAPPGFAKKAIQNVVNTSKVVTIGNTNVSVDAPTSKLGVIAHDGNEFSVKLALGQTTFDLRGNLFEILQIEDVRDTNIDKKNTIIANDFLYVPAVMRRIKHLSRCHYGSRPHIAMDMIMMTDAARKHYMAMAMHMLIAAAILAQYEENSIKKS
jgi:hypothetical protein